MAILDDEDLEKVQAAAKAKWMSLPTVARVLVIIAAVLVIAGMFGG